MQYKNIFGDDFQWNQVSYQHFFRSGGGMHPLHPPLCPRLVSNLHVIIDNQKLIKSFKLMKFKLNM